MKNTFSRRPGQRSQENRFDKNRGRGNRDFQRSNFGGKGFSQDYNRPTMHTAICSECGEQCEVPFKPRGDKPVFCSRCFDQQGGRTERKQFFDKPRFQDKQMYQATCSGCGNTCMVPFQPRGDKPVYCDQCFSGQDTKGSRNTSANQGQQDQISSLSKKLDKCLNLLEALVNKKDIKASKEVKATKEVKVNQEISIPKKDSKNPKKAPAAKKVVAKKPPLKKAKGKKSKK